MIYLPELVKGSHKMTNAPIDRLMVLNVSGSQSGALLKELSRAGFQFTLVDSRGGGLQEAAVYLLIGFPDERMLALLETVRSNCRPYRQYVPTQGLAPAELSGLPMVEAQMGGALVYVMNVERFEQI